MRTNFMNTRNNAAFFRAAAVCKLVCIVSRMWCLVQDPGAVPLGAWWVSVPTVVPSKLQTSQKQRTMTALQLGAYASAQKKVLLSSNVSGLPLFALLDIQHLTRQCGVLCTSDGIHSVPEVYEAALQNVMHHAARCAETADRKTC
jgi:histone H3/H4